MAIEGENRTRSPAVIEGEKRVRNSFLASMSYRVFPGRGKIERQSLAYARSGHQPVSCRCKGSGLDRYRRSSARTVLDPLR